MVTQVITVGADGSMSGLQVKPGKGLDLRQFGRASIVRASEIVWDERLQAWVVDVLQKAGRGRLSTLKWEEAGLPGTPAGARDEVSPIWCTFLFDNYEDAVAAEIAYLDALRVAGIR